MKNIHILPTDKPSKGYVLGKCIKNLSDVKIGQFTKTYYLMFDKEYFQPQNIYITSDEEIKEGDWFIDDYESDAISIIYKCLDIKPFEYIRSEFDKHDFKDCKKIILTTDQDLIKDGVQAIDDEFLEWFIKNPSCEEVEVKMNQGRYFDYGGNVHITNAYKIIIPKEQQKQRLEKYSERFNNKENELVQGIFNSENWGNRLVNEEPKQETLEEVAKGYAEANKFLSDRPFEFNRDLVAFINGAKWQEQQTIEEVFEWLTTNNYLTDLKETLIENFKNK